MPAACVAFLCIYGRKPARFLCVSAVPLPACARQLMQLVAAAVIRIQAEDVPALLPVCVSPWRDPPPADAAGSPPPAAVIRKEKRRRMCLRPSSTYTAHSVVSKCALRKFCALLLRIISPPPLCFLPVLHSLYQRNNALYNLHVSRRFDNAALQLFFSPFLCTRLY